MSIQHNDDDTNSDEDPFKDKLKKIQSNSLKNIRRKSFEPDFH